MLARALWTSLLALLAWIPIGRLESRALHRERGERVLFAISALDVAKDSPSRAAEQRIVPRQLAAARKPPTPRSLPPHTADAFRVETPTTVVWEPRPRPEPTGWRGFQSQRLIVPHDATAPPSPPRRS